MKSLFFKKKRLQLKSNLRFSIFEISLAGILISLWLVSLKFIKIPFLGYTSIGFSQMWMIIIALVFSFWKATIILITGDTIQIILSGLNKWMWQYAIIPIMINIIVHLCLHLFNKNKKIWLSFVFVFFILFSLLFFYFLIVFLNNTKPKKVLKIEWIYINNLDKITIIIFGVFIFLFFLKFLLCFYFFLTNKNKYNDYLLIFTICFFVFLICVWFWGPISHIAYRNRLLKSKSNINHWSFYHFYLGSRIIKTPLLLPIYIYIILSTYNVYQELKPKGNYKW